MQGQNFCVGFKFQKCSVHAMRNEWKMNPEELICKTHNSWFPITNIKQIKYVFYKATQNKFETLKLLKVHSKKKRKRVSKKSSQNDS